MIFLKERALCGANSLCIIDRFMTMYNIGDWGSQFTYVSLAIFRFTTRSLYSSCGAI